MQDVSFSNKMDCDFTDLLDSQVTGVEQVKSDWITVDCNYSATAYGAYDNFFSRF